MEYDQQIASHYASYRPPLHQMILNEALGKNTSFQKGLDIGCGTGRSTTALLPYCKKIVGIDPSKEMLSNATPHPSISYNCFDGANLPFRENQFDLITFAGSLFYAKSQRLLNEVIRVSKLGTRVLVYDFEIKTEPHFGEIRCRFIKQKKGGIRSSSEFF